MKTHFKFAILLITCISLSACNATDIGAYESGVKITQGDLKKILNDGDKEKVLSLIGEPTRKEYRNNIDIWFYDYKKIRHIGKNISTSSVFEFDKEKIIRHYETTTKDTNGLLN